MVFAKTCGQCAGTGVLRQASCTVCAGSGVEARAEMVPLSVPAGVADGDRLRVAGRGHAGVRGGEAGDLYITVQVEPHPVFRREGDDLHVTVPIGIHEAALGARVEIPTFDGPARLRVPPGAQSGQHLRLHERGVPSRRGGRRGDLVVELRVVLPSVLDERSKDLLRAFGEINAGDVRAELWREAPRP
jgi:molecular chaperone DnaJ